MQKAFELTIPLWEIVVRTSVVYLVLVALFRIVPKRSAGGISPNDMLGIVLVGALAAGGIMGGSHSVGDILIMAAVVLGWGYVCDVLEYRFPFIHHLLRDARTPLVWQGRLLRKNLKREMITEEALMTILHKEGVQEVAKVRAAWLEADGQISVVKAET